MTSFSGVNPMQPLIGTESVPYGARFKTASSLCNQSLLVMELGIINLSYMNPGEVIRSFLSFSGVHALTSSRTDCCLLGLRSTWRKDVMVPSSMTHPCRTYMSPHSKTCPSCLSSSRERWFKPPYLSFISEDLISR